MGYSSINDQKIIDEMDNIIDEVLDEYKHLPLSEYVAQNVGNKVHDRITQIDPLIRCCPIQFRIETGFMIFRFTDWLEVGEICSFWKYKKRPDTCPDLYSH